MTRIVLVQEVYGLGYEVNCAFGHCLRQLIVKFLHKLAQLANLAQLQHYTIITFMVECLVEFDYIFVFNFPQNFNFIKPDLLVDGTGHDLDCHFLPRLFYCCFIYCCRESLAYLSTQLIFVHNLNTILCLE